MTGSASAAATDGVRERSRKTPVSAAARVTARLCTVRHSLPKRHSLPSLRGAHCRRRRARAVDAVANRFDHRTEVR